MYRLNDYCVGYKMKDAKKYITLNNYKKLSVEKHRESPKLQLMIGVVVVSNIKPKNSC